MTDSFKKIPNQQKVSTWNGMTGWIQQDTTMGWQNALILTSAFGWKTKQGRSDESCDKDGFWKSVASLS